MPRPTGRSWPLLAVAAVYFLCAAHGEGCCGSEKAGPAKDRVFVKERGRNTGPLEGRDVGGTCAADEIGKAACYGRTLVHCSSDGEPHAVDCVAKLGTDMCGETDTAADCTCSTDPKPCD